MGTGLKQQWGVGDPKDPTAQGQAKGGSDEQANHFKAEFQKRQGTINEHLQYTSVNAPADRHGAFAARRDASYGAFQGALGKIDRNDASKAKGDIERVLADQRTLCTEVATLHQQTEKAKKDWQSRQAGYDKAVHQVEELEAWEDAKAPALRGLVDGIRTQVNERRWAPASTTFDALAPKLKPIYDEYLKQREAKPKYEQQLAEQTAKLDVLKAAEQPSKPMTAKLGEAEAAFQDGKAKADAKDFVAGCTALDKARARLAELDKLANDPARQKYLADSKGLDKQSTPQPDPPFKTLDAAWAAIDEALGQALPLADAGDYAGASKALAASKAKREEYQRKREELIKARDAYQVVADALEPKMQQMNACTLKALAGRKATLVSAYAATKAFAAGEDFAGAKKSADLLAADLDAFAADAGKERDRIRAQINGNMPGVEAELKGRSASTSGEKKLIDAMVASIKAAVAGNDDAALEKAGQDMDKLPAMLEQLKQIDDVRGKLDAAASDDDKKKAAKKIVDEIARKGEIAKMPVEARNVLVQTLMKNADAGDTAAINKIWATPTMDSAFDEVDKPARDSIIKAYAEDPKVLEYRKKWKTMNKAEKQEAMKYLTSIPCGPKGWNVGDPDKFEFFDQPKAANGSILYGSYTADTGVMKLNTHDDAHGRFDELLDTIAHEIGHKKQRELVTQYRNGTLKPGDPNYEQAKAFALHEDYRVDHEDEFQKIYSTSPKESHSRVMGSELQAEMAKKFPGGAAPP